MVIVLNLFPKNYIKLIDLIRHDCYFQLKQNIHIKTGAKVSNRELCPGEDWAIDAKTKRLIVILMTHGDKFQFFFSNYALYAYQTRDWVHFHIYYANYKYKFTMGQLPRGLEAKGNISHCGTKKCIKWWFSIFFKFVLMPRNRVPIKLYVIPFESEMNEKSSI